MMRSLITLVLFFISTVACATGWHDYNLEIGDGYSIFRASSFDVNLAKDMNILVSNHRFSEIGPITNYYKDNDVIFLKTHGWHYRKLFEGDTFKEIDRSKEYYFIVSVLSSDIKGPLSEPEFNQDAVVVNKQGFVWVAPKNPNFWTPILGTLAFILVALVFNYLKYWYVTVPITILIIYCCFKMWEKWHKTV